jgi:ribosomal protein L15
MLGEGRPFFYHLPQQGLLRPPSNRKVSQLQLASTDKRQDKRQEEEKEWIPEKYFQSTR